MPNCSATCADAGAIIDEETVLINVKDDTTMVDAHFWWYGQLNYAVGSLDKKESPDSLFRIRRVLMAVPVHPQNVGVRVGCLFADIQVGRCQW